MLLHHSFLENEDNHSLCCKSVAIYRARASRAPPYAASRLAWPALSRLSLPPLPPSPASAACLR